MTLLSPLIGKQQLLAELNIGEAGLTHLRKRKISPIPEPIKIGNKLYWRREEVETWLRGYLPKKGMS